MLQNYIKIFLSDCNADNPEIILLLEYLCCTGQIRFFVKNAIIVAGYALLNMMAEVRKAHSCAAPTMPALG
jgi:hypothetical protein